MSAKIENINSEDSIAVIRVDTVEDIKKDSLILSIEDSLLLQGENGENLDKLLSSEQKFFTETTQKTGTNLPITLNESDGLVFLFLVCFLFLSFSFKEIISFMREKLVLALSSSKNEKLYDTTVTTKDTFNLYGLMFISILVFSLSFYCILDLLNINKHCEDPFRIIGMFVAVTVIFVLFKLLLNRLIGYIFDKQRELKTWSFSYLILFGALGGICFIPSLFLVYPKIGYEAIVIFVLIVFLIVQINLFIRIILYFTSQGLSILFTIAYLCAVEIVPYLFLGASMVYLYKVDIFNVVL